jgi:DNA-binding GntR family transcriptional regulator
MAHPQRGFSVRTLGIEDLVDLTRTRIHLESLATRRVAENGDLTWETGVVAAHHALTRTRTVERHDGGTTRREWVEAHRSLHQALVAGRGSLRLISVATLLPY